MSDPAAREAAGAQSGPTAAPRAAGAPAASRGDDGNVPPSASARAYLRASMPAIYAPQQEAFAMRLLYAFERVLDRPLAIVDSLETYLAPRLAPPDMLDAMAGWLGLALGDARSERLRRALLGNAEKLARGRGTRAGLELSLNLCFPHLRIEVVDHGRVVFREDPGKPPPEPYPGFAVRCRRRLSAGERARVQRAIERHAPLQVQWDLLPREPAEASS